MSNLKVFSCGDVLNFMSEVIQFQLWFLYIYYTLLVVISIIRLVHLQDEILTKTDEKFNNFRIFAIIAENREQIK